MRSRTFARIGYLSPGDPVGRVYRIEAFRQGLKELGYIEGKNIIIEYRFARAKWDRLPELARELVRLEVDIIFAQGGPATKAAKSATQTIPIVTSSSDPVGSGLVASLAQPGGNITGLANLTSELVGKRLPTSPSFGLQVILRSELGERPRLPLNPWACSSRPRRYELKTI